MLSHSEKDFCEKVKALILDNIQNGGKSARKDSLEKLAKTFGIDDQTEVKELAEYAIVQMARKIAMQPDQPHDQYAKIVELYNSQPTLSHRSSTSMIYQQYSTPAPIAFIGGLWCMDKNELGSIKRSGGFTKNHFAPSKSTYSPNDYSKPLVLEPSAGNGLFTTAFNPQNVWVNEIDKFRAKILSDQGYYKVTEMDASIPANFEKLFGKFDIVTSNPPFDSLQHDITFNGSEFGVLDHLMAAIALECLKPNGKAAIIIGGHTAYDNKGRVQAGKNRKFISYLYQNYNVEDIISINSKQLYTKQGTGFNVRLILIDGKKAVKSGFPPLFHDLDIEKQKIVNTFDELYSRIFPMKQQNTKTLELEAEALVLELELTNLNGFNGASPMKYPIQPITYNILNGPGDVDLPDYVPEIKLTFKKSTAKLIPADFTINNSQSINSLIKKLWQRNTIEVAERFFIIFLSRANKPIGWLNVSLGTKTGTMVDPAQVVAVAAKTNCSGAIIAHNHPSGNLRASEADLQLTRKLKEALKLIDVVLLDHLIVTTDGYTSFADEGLFGLTGLGMAYTPVSDACNTLNVDVSDSMAFETHEALRKMQVEVGGDVTEFVREKLNYPTKLDLCKALMAEQIDGVATAIYNIEKRDNFLIIGDQTGIGKGRQAASIIRYGVENKLTPVFLTEKDTLFSDMYRDLIDIGCGHYKPFIVNARSKKSNVKGEDANGNQIIIHRAPEKTLQKDLILHPEKIKGQFDFIMSTYSQFNRNGIVLKGKDKGQDKRDDKGRFLEAVSVNNIMILDESHNAGGDSKTGKFVTGCVASSKGGAFLSATFAKTPENMPLYAAKTALQDANMKPEDFIQAFIKGGVALQEVISAQLVEEGQMIRRQRVLGDLKVSKIILTDQAIEHASIADKITAVMRRIVLFEKMYIEEIVENADDELVTSQGSAAKAAGGKAGATSSPYFSKLFNVINQMLFSIKAKEVAEETIKELMQGKKVVIAFSSTMGAFLSNTAVGEIINADFTEVLKRGLDSTLSYTEKDSSGKGTKIIIPLDSLSFEGQKEYHNIMKDIAIASTGITVSPIDILIQEIEKAGFKVAEVTGRNKKLQYSFSDEDVQNIKRIEATKPKRKINKDDNEEGENEEEDDTMSGLGNAETVYKKNTLALVMPREPKDKTEAFYEFNNNDVDVLLLNQSGSTGVSAHAVTTKRVPLDKVKTRVMIFLQSELNINTQVQKIGRINRTGQVLPPEYKYITSIIPAEQRMMMMMMMKIKSLDANTSSNQKNSDNIIDVPDFLNKYGDEVVLQYLIDNPEINTRIGDPAKLNGADDESEESENPIRGLAHKASGKVAILSVKEQEHFYTNVMESYKKEILKLKQQGKYDLEMENKNYKSVTLGRQILYVNPTPGKSVFANHSFMEHVEIDNLVKPYSQYEVQEKINEKIKGFNSPKDYTNQLESEFDLFAQKKLNNISAELLEWHKSKIGKIKEEKAFLKLDDQYAMEQYIEDRTKELDKQRDDKTEKAQEEYNKHVTYVKMTFRYFVPGKSVEFPTSIIAGGAIYSKAVFIGYDIAMNKENPYTPGNIYLAFAMADSNRHFDLNIVNDGRQQVDLCRANSYDVKSDYLENWNELCGRSNKNRVERYIITGNLLQTLSDGNYGSGTLVNYTIQSGGTSKGYIMPDKWKPNYDVTKTSNAPNILIPVPVYMAREFIKQNARSNRPLKTNTSNVTFARNYDGNFTINVPVSKTQGGSIFLNTDLMELVVGKNFNKRGDLMVGVCFENKIDEALQHLQKVNKLNVMVTSEELKNIDIPEGKAPDVQPEPKATNAPKIHIVSVPTVDIVEPEKADDTLDNTIMILELEAEALALELQLLNMDEH
ncbi:MAG: JAB domain-containing protein [bacterium]|nr:JAB domain-containing protein [bacterium]